MPVVDAHAHIYPDKIAKRATQSIGEFYHISMQNSTGSVAQLLAAKDDSSLTHFIVHSVATAPKNVETINTFIASQCAMHPEFIGFMAMHQDYLSLEKEIERAIDLGLCGMKLHPDTQQVNIDDPRLMDIYEIIQGRIPLILHMGDYRYDYSHPRRLKKVLHAFPDLVVNAAHFGAWSTYEIGYDVLHEENLFVDASSSMFMLGTRRFTELTRMWGTDRVMFGSDYPMWKPAEELRKFIECGFSEAELENMLWHNAERFIGRKIN